MRWTEEDLANFQKRQAPVVDQPKRNKYGNHKVKVGDETFDSKKEYARWQQLQMMEKSGIIEGLERQKSFELAPAVVLNGRRKPALKYCADFIYYENGELVVEDTKSVATCQDATFRIKKHLMMSVHQIEVRES